ncbi:MAG: asparagine synthase (glutamine-hydrolyzing) [Thermodesulfobacteriota bacterium]
MCGICGKLVFDGSIPSDDLVQAMCRTMVHRGPDDEGIFTNPYIGMGQRRLSIIDLAPGACPPLANEDQTVHVVFNGEIYNFQELRGKLQKRGHRFTTNTDTEVIVHLYEEKGTECLSELRGMFALAIWDECKKRLFCARDRLGKKPLCYTLTPKSFVFGSEIKAITIDLDVSVSPNYHAIDQYLTHQFVPSPLTAFAGIYRLQPGEYLVCDITGNIQKKRYWEPPNPKKLTTSMDEIAEELLLRLRESLKLRMIADVPLGAFLSGGIDSAAIVALMAEQSSSPVKTFSIGFEEQSYNELPYARLVAKRYGTEHHEFIVKPNAAEIIPLLIRHYNVPFADSSAIPTYYVSKITRQYVTVALSGDGGDENFAGYENYASLQAWNRWNVLPRRLRMPFAVLGKMILEPFATINMAARVQRGLKMIGARDIKERRLFFAAILKPEVKRFAYTENFKKFLRAEPTPVDSLADYPFDETMDDLDWLMRHDLAFYLPDCLMVKTDVASMANSLEVRCPFLDHELVEFAASIPSIFKRNAHEGKVILKHALKGLLPPEILTKPKSGFGLPIAKWFRRELLDLLKGTLLDERTSKRGIFNVSFLNKLVREHADGRRDWSGRLWALLFLELWFREFID